MGAYGTLDTVGRGSIVYAAAIAAGGSGPANRLEQVRRTPFWLIHGEVDVVVPNFLPYMGDPDGGGTLGMLGLIDPTFGNIGSTELITLDDYASAADDPTAAAVLIYSQYPASFDHSTVAIGWTGSMVSDFSTWLFSHPVEEPAPRLELVWDSIGGGWQLEWTGTNWVLQESVGISADWTDATPPNGSPYPVLTGNGSRYYRLREADYSSSQLRDDSDLSLRGVECGGCRMEGRVPRGRDERGGWNVGRAVARPSRMRRKRGMRGRACQRGGV